MHAWRSTEQTRTTDLQQQHSISTYDTVQPPVIACLIKYHLYEDNSQTRCV